MNYLTALSACQIIANNAFDGYLAEQADGPPIASDDDGILTKDRYFFIVPDRTTYAIVPSSQEWEFPEAIPPVWKDAEQTTARLSGNSVPGRCVVTEGFIIERAHLIPTEDKEWFSNNAMGTYDPHPASDPSDCPANCIVLDRSLHAVFDRRLWAFVPRHSRFAVQTICLPETITYGMLSEFVHEYHGRHMRRIDQTQVEYLFPRFAWAALCLIKGFILMPRPNTRLARYRVWEDEVPQVKEEDLPAKDVDMLFGGGGTRSASPRKRSRTASEQGRGSGRECVEEWDWGDWNWSNLTGPTERLRKRRRTSSSPDETWGEPTAFEDRGRNRMREQDAVRRGKQHGRTSGASFSDSIPSLAQTSSGCGTSASSISPRPVQSSQVKHHTALKDEG